ncbi:M28 family peptidase [Streptomyces sp. B1I3]|uniref:M28 family peptidase n=1 Tax=Streptomyces sp. B1I3 TaxID=3042264 RepID=UPI00278B9644|nr:M28 family peptidase [Streptomyces sp. B1I3]MDQ0792939.1 Zn-dependent M28 family amino/carboxypeptidase [Streptomyces sp. B1I3]
MNASARRAVTALAAVALATPLLLASASPASSWQHRPGQDAAALSRALVREASAKDALTHLKKFQAIADSAGGHRVAGSLGHDASAAYVYQQLKKAGFNVEYQRFDFVYTQTLAEKLSTVTPAPHDIEIRALTYTTSTPAGGIRADLAAVPVDADGTTGCEPGDFASGSYTGRIALIKRGGCAFAVKQQQAAAAGAIGALIYNNIDAGYGPLSGTLGDPSAAKIPTGGISKAEGEKLAADLAAGPVNVSIEIRQLQENRSTNNVVAETARGNAAETVMLGASLDSVHAGPGINDNGSGSAALLDVALKLAKQEKNLRNKVRFAWWSAAESGLVGSHHYVANLLPLDKQEIKLYLNFELIASTNGAMFVYDGDNSDGANTQSAPAGSDRLEQNIAAFLGKQGRPHAGTPFVARFDYGPFLDAGIPAGGTFAGAEALKTPAEAAVFGGTAGATFDPNYHGARDDINNISPTMLEENIDVIANSVGTYAHDISSVRPPATAATRTAADRAVVRPAAGSYGVTR